MDLDVKHDKEVPNFSNPKILFYVKKHTHKNWGLIVRKF